MPESIIEGLPLSEPDPILELDRQFRGDPRPEKIGAAIGVIIENDRVFMPEAIRVAEIMVAQGESRIDYFGPEGDAEWLGDTAFHHAAANVAFGDAAQPLIAEGKLAAAATTGGTGALSVLYEVIAGANKHDHKNRKILLGKPSWGNHPAAMVYKGLQVETYSHVKNDAFDADAAIDAISNSSPDTIPLFHCSGHNPTGVDPSLEEWHALASAMQGRVAIFDAPYIGLVNGFDQDAAPIRIFMEQGVPIMIALSFSKTAGLYKKRCGDILIPATSRDSALKMQRVLNEIARYNYSSAAADGQEIVGTAYKNSQLFKSWKIETTAMGEKLGQRRVQLAQQMPQFPFLDRQRGLFSLLPLIRSEINHLKIDDAIYMLLTGRINVGGIEQHQTTYFADRVNHIWNQRN